jgi:hypothetical protein
LFWNTVWANSTSTPADEPFLRIGKVAQVTTLASLSFLTCPCMLTQSMGHRQFHGPRHRMPQATTINDLLNSVHYLDLNGIRAKTHSELGSCWRSLYAHVHTFSTQGCLVRCRVLFDLLPSFKLLRPKLLLAAWRVGPQYNLSAGLRLLRMRSPVAPSFIKARSCCQSAQSSRNLHSHH